MIKQQILKYFQNQKNQFDLNFEPAFSIANEKAIHDMRVSIKRLRLIYRFLDFVSDKQFCTKKKSKLLVNVFKSAGPLRDAQIQLSILEELKEDLKSNYPNLNEFLNIKLKEGIKKFREKGVTFNVNEIDQLFNFSEAVLKIIIDFPDLQQAFENYKNNRQQKIQTLLKSAKNKIDFHQIRKRIKDLTYLAEIQQIQIEKPNNEVIHLKQLGKKLGDWHDLEVFLNELNSIKSKQKKTGDDIEKIEVKLKQQQEKIIDEFYLRYNEFS